MRIQRRMLIITMVLTLVLSYSIYASAKIQWNVKPVDKFVIPEGNLIPGGDLSSGIEGWYAVYGWKDNYQVDNKNHLTGGASLFFDLKEEDRGRMYRDVVVDGSKKYRVGFVAKTEELTYPFQMGIFFGDMLGGWVDVNAALSSGAIDKEYLNGIQSVGIAIRGPVGDSEEDILLEGTKDWHNFEMILDLPTLAKDLRAGLGQIVKLRIEVLVASTGTGKVWVDNVYLCPVN